MNAPGLHEREPYRGGTLDGGVSPLVVVLAVTGTILLALGAFWLSFTTLQDLAVLSGIPAGQAWVWPLIVDGVILEATISVVALRNSAPAARRFAWLLLASGAAVSVAANVTHAVISSDIRVPAVVAAVVASIPPLVLLAMTHLTVELTRNARPRPAAPSTLGDAAGADDAAADDATVVVDARPVREAPALETSPEARPSLPVGRDEARARALQLEAAGVPKRQIAAELGVHPTTVGRWVNAPDGRQDGADHD